MLRFCIINMTRSINAFTLVEMLVVMILGAVVSALLYQAVMMILVLHHRFEQRQERVQSMTSWYVILYKDIARAETLAGSGDTLVVVDGEMTTVYTLTPNALVRQRAAARDSLHVVDGQFLVTECDSSSLLSCVGLTFHYDEQLVHWRFRKKYSAAGVLRKMMIP